MQATKSGASKNTSAKSSPQAFVQYSAQTFYSKHSSEKLEKLNTERSRRFVWRDESSTYQTLLRKSGQTALTNHGHRQAKILGTV